MQGHDGASPGEAAEQGRVRAPADFNPRTDAPLDFPDRDLAAMSAADYERLGFMAGLEVHQQLWTRSKLFCRCPAGRYVRDCDAEVLRHMRPTLSELGEYDGTALMEFKTRKEIVYLLERSTVCTYEIDDTPPFPIDEEAIRIALEVCLLFDLSLVSELHVMRKQYLDGSIPTGFQRTIMMGLAGRVPFRVPELGVDKELGIRQLSLEEDSCREVSDIGHRIIFRTDRLGMPLTEVVTEPDLLTPWELQAGARLVARATRTLGRVRRGPGAARQDVNVSVAGGRRIEIKGVHHHRGLPRLVHIEGFRQLNLLRIQAELQRRGLTPALLQIPSNGRAWEASPLVEDATSILKRSDYEPLRLALEQGQMACALRLPECAGIMNQRTQPGIHFAGEIADRVRVIACLMARPFIIHSDIAGYGLRHTEWRQLQRALRAGPGDTVVVVWGPAADCDTAAREVLLRVAEALEGVPAETRQAFPDGTTGFERILPGPDRMYPDTDTPPLPIPDAWVETARRRLPARPWEMEARYERAGLAPHEAARLVDAAWAPLFEALSPATPAVARRLYYALEKRMPRWFLEHTGSRSGRPGPPSRRRHATRAVTRLAEARTSAESAPQAASPLPAAERLAPILRAVEGGALRLEALDPALEQLLRDPTQEPMAVATALRPLSPDAKQVDALVGQVRAGIDGLAGKARDTQLRWAHGVVMPALRGRVDPGQVRARLEATLEQVGH